MGKLGKIEFDIEQTQQVSLPYAIVGFVVFILSMKIFKDYSKTYLPDEELEESL